MKESNPKKNTLQQDKDLFVHITEQNNENDTPTRENASKFVEDLNTEVLDVISKFKQSAVDGFQRYQLLEEE
jgi:hypothetical protein